MTKAVAAALTALGAVSAPLSGQDASPLDVHVVRSYRGGQTLFDAFLRVPFTLLDPLAPGARGDAVYRLAVSVRDSSGLELWSQSWTQTVPATALDMRGGSAGDHFTFAAAPGRYTVEVTVTDSATGRIARERAAVTAFAAHPGASDLLLAAGLRLAAPPADTAPRAGEIRKGATLLHAAGRPVLTPQQPELAYYLEIYRERPETVAVAAEVQSAAGTRVIGTPEQPIPLAPEGGVTRGLLNLAGLPPGSYRLVLVVRTADSTLRREAEFRMAGFETGAAVAAAARPADVFENMAEAQLDTVYLPLVYLMTSDEQGIYPTLSVEGKRHWLRQFWAKRDPTPGTPRNEAQEEFYTRIAEANRRFREGGAGQIPGWRTDRGRIFIKYGPPDEVLSRPVAGATNPYEVWKYSRERPRKYVFLDQTRFGNYALIWTDDRREPSRPNWQELLGGEALQEVLRF
ncbi:MAG TPA: GWxTD domain-containing protein [Gemmatimonadales bacterium]|nr:GWxTD domain-containing protein [Gemmatimonadales bacterium]